MGRGATHRADVCIPFPCARGDSTRASNVPYGRRNMGCFSGMFPQSLFHQTPSRFVVVNALPPLRGWLLSNGRRRRAVPVAAAAAAAALPPLPPRLATWLRRCAAAALSPSVRLHGRRPTRPTKAGQAKSRSIAAGGRRRGPQSARLTRKSLSSFVPSSPPPPVPAFLEERSGEGGARTTCLSPVQCFASASHSPPRSSSASIAPLFPRRSHQNQEKTAE